MCVCLWQVFRALRIHNFAVQFNRLRQSRSGGANLQPDLRFRLWGSGFVLMLYRSSLSLSLSFSASLSIFIFKHKYNLHTNYLFTCTYLHLDRDIQYIYFCACVYTYIYTYIHVLIPLSDCQFILCPCVHTVLISTGAYANTKIHALIHSHVHTCKYAQTPAHTNMATYIHTYVMNT